MSPLIHFDMHFIQTAEWATYSRAAIDNKGLASEWTIAFKQLIKTGLKKP